MQSNYIISKIDFDAMKHIHNDSSLRYIICVKTSHKWWLKNSIAEYTNSQNAINASDLKSVGLLQRQIETFLDGKEISYIRKAGMLVHVLEGILKKYQ